MAFVGIAGAGEFRGVTRSHIIAWRKNLEGRQLAGSTVRRKLAALSSLFEFLCEANAVPTNPVKGVKRPRVESYEGKTPALGDHQAKDLLQAPIPRRSRVNATGPSCPCSFFMGCGAKKWRR